VSSCSATYTSTQLTCTQHAFASVAHGELAKCGVVAKHQKQATLLRSALTASAAEGCQRCRAARNYSSPGVSKYMLGLCGFDCQQESDWMQLVTLVIGSSANCGNVMRDC